MSEPNEGFITLTVPPLDPAEVRWNQGHMTPAAIAAWIGSVRAWADVQPHTPTHSELFDVAMEELRRMCGYPT